MRYLLDTNVCVVYLNGRSELVRDQLLSTSTEDMAVCSRNCFMGRFHSSNPTRTLERQQSFLARSVSRLFEDEAALLAGQIRAKLASSGTPGSYDLQIAAIALANNLILAAHNTREFRRIKELQYCFDQKSDRNRGALRMIKAILH